MSQKPQRPRLVREFWPRYRTRVVTMLVIFQALVLCGVAAILWFMGIFHSDLAASIIVLGIVALSGILTPVLVFLVTATPIKYILTAITHVSGEPTETAPNPSDKRFRRTGLDTVLEAIYNLDAQGSKPGAATPKTGSEARNLVEAALDETLCGFAALDGNRKIIYANKATPVRMTTDGVMTLDLIFDETDSLLTWWDECAESSVKAERTWPRISNKLPNEEGRRFFDVIASYDKDAPAEMVLTLVDRTNLYNVGEEELDFIAFAAHELRGPITVIRGYLDVLQGELDTVLENDQKELFRRLVVSANKLSGYINNILNTSRYDRRHLRMHLAETTVLEVYQTIADDMELRASSQGRLLTVNIPNNLPTVAADTASLSEVFGNLIDNAIKYSNEGGTILVTAQLHGEMVDVIIQDHGIGMPGNVVSNLFQKFYRSHRSRETVAGTGIGLYISKAIIESHGGTISVQSEEGKGSTFTVSLPLYQTVAEKLKNDNNGNEAVMKKAEEGVWIKNHSSFRG